MKGQPRSAKVDGRIDRRLADAARADTPENLLAFQRTLKTAFIRPLTDKDRTQGRWVDGTPMAAFAERFVKSNDRLTALERLEIYNRMYWFRLIDCFHDDNPGLRAALGDVRFIKLAEAYLQRHPSSSFTLRNLCRNLETFIRKNPRLTKPDTAFALDIARFEWAQTVAFDEAARPVITPDFIAQTPPTRLRLALQPYVSLLALDYPVDDYVIAVKKRDALRSAASNASTAAVRSERSRNVPRPLRQRTFVAVHRLDTRLYYKRLAAPAYKILCALRDGRPLEKAISAAGRTVKAEDVREWFGTWMHLGWFCHPE
jgi:hypothetical protein